MSFLSSYIVFWKSSELKNRAESITTFPCGFSVLCWAGTGSLTSDVFICDRSTLLSEGSCNFSSLCVKLISNHTSMKLFQRGKKCYFPSSSAKGGKLPQGWGGHGWASPSLHSPSARGWRWAWRAVSLRSASDNWRNPRLCVRKGGSAGLEQEGWEVGESCWQHLKEAESMKSIKNRKRIVYLKKWIWNDQIGNERKTVRGMEKTQWDLTVNCAV